MPRQLCPPRACTERVIRSRINCSCSSRTNRLPPARVLYRCIQHRSALLLEDINRLRWPMRNVNAEHEEKLTGIEKFAMCTSDDVGPRASS